MNKIVTYFSVGTAAFALAFGFEKNLFVATLVAMGCVLLTALGYKLESYIKTNGNQLLDHIVYWFTKSDEIYNIKNKQSTYTYNGNDSYTFRKNYEIIPTINDLDRMDDRFSWSAPSAGCDIDSTESKHSIKTVWQREFWTCFSIYFNEECKKRKPYKVGSVVSNLVDADHTAVPFLSNTIDRKTKCLTLVVVFPKDCHPATAKFNVFPSDTSLNSIAEEDLAYDDVIGGFKRIIHYPRKRWRYVISWN